MILLPRPWNRRAALAVLAAGLLTACGRRAEAVAPHSGKVEVGVVTATPTDVPLVHELQGRASAYRVAEVRARVNGVVLKRLFDEGSEVRTGQPLFQIDPAPYEAALDSAKATLARAQANREFQRLQETRYEQLITADVVSKQDYTSVVAAHGASEADVAAGTAAVRLASINLGYTLVRSPVSGKIGRAAVTEGAYVQQGPATLLATVQQLDPIYVDLTQSSDELRRLRERIDSGEIRSEQGEVSATVVFEEGSEYPHKGKLQFSDVTVDQGTGSVVLRAIVANPERALLPGMFLRARLEQGVTPRAILVPQAALARDPTGVAIVMVVDPEKKVEVRRVRTARANGNDWVVTEGLKSGDQIIVEGLQKISPGTEVVAVAAAPKTATTGPK
jgi:membrane fusion protein (multidrug efflux system)